MKLGPRNPDVPGSIKSHRQLPGVFFTVDSRSTPRPHLSIVIWSSDLTPASWEI